MFTFTLTADSAEELNAQILAAAQKIADATWANPEKTLADFPLAEIVAHLNEQGFKVK